MRTRSSLVVVVGLLLGTTTLAACSSSSSSSATQKASQTASAAAALSGQPIIIGTICSCSGAEASATAGYPGVINAWQEMINHSGGINGHPVKVIVLDDGGNAATAVQDAKTLVQDHVLAVAGEFSIQDPSFAGYLASQHIAVVGPNPFGDASRNSDFFPAGANASTVIYGMLADAQAAGHTKIAGVACAEATSCALENQAVAGVAGALLHGVSVVYKATVTFNQPSYAAQCLAAKQAGATAMFINDNVPVITRIVSQCSSEGYAPTYLGLGLGLYSSAGNGYLISQPNQSIFNTSNAAVRSLRQSLSTYDPQLAQTPSNSEFNDGAAEVWAGFQLFKAAATAAKLTPASSPADVYTGLYSLKDETLGGLSSPLNFVRGKVTLNSCWFSETVRNGSPAAANGGNYQCVPVAKRTTLYAIFGIHA